MNKEKYVTSKEAQQMLDVSRVTLRDWEIKRKIDKKMFGGRVWYLRVEIQKIKDAIPSELTHISLVKAQKKLGVSRFTMYKWDETKALVMERFEGKVFYPVEAVEKKLNP